MAARLDERLLGIQRELERIHSTIAQDKEVHERADEKQDDRLSALENFRARATGAGAALMAAVSALGFDTFRS